MAFVFRLDKVLGVRKREEDSAARVHALARAKLDRAKSALKGLECELIEAQVTLEGCQRADRVDGETLHVHSLRCAGLDVDMQRAEREIEAANDEVRAAALALTAAHQAVEILQKLRERDLEEWKKAQARKETYAMDEVAVMRHRSKEA